MLTGGSEKKYTTMLMLMIKLAAAPERSELCLLRSFFLVLVHFALLFLVNIRWKAPSPDLPDFDPLKREQCIR